MTLSENKHLFDSNFDPLDQLSLLKEKCNNMTSSRSKNLAPVKKLVRDKIPCLQSDNAMSLMLRHLLKF